MTQLFEHQKEGITFLEKVKKGILALDMGLGKTRISIVAAGNQDHGAMVICPASLKINWEREIHMVFPEDIVQIHSSKDIVREDAAWHIFNYDIVGKRLSDIEDMARKGIVKTLILDEAHYIKGKSIRSSLIAGGMANITGLKTKYAGIAGLFERVYALTGTPLMNRPIELYNLLKAIEHPLAMGVGARTEYAKRYCGAFLRTMWDGRRFMDETGASHLDELALYLKPVMLRRKKEDTLDLPDRIVSEVIVEMSSVWEKTYDTAFEAYIQFLEDHPEILADKNISNIIKARHLVEIQKLKQVCSLSKIDRIVADVENAIEQDQKVIIFSQYKETVRNLELLLKKHGAVTLTGDDDMDERQRAVDAFQNNEGCKVFVANMKAGGVGLNLTAASIVIFADMEWSPAIHDQCIDRAHRIGQAGTVNAYFYVCKGTIEEDIVEILEKKRGIAEEVIDGKSPRAEKNTSVQKDFLERMKRKVINR